MQPNLRSIVAQCCRSRRRAIGSRDFCSQTYYSHNHGYNGARETRRQRFIRRVTHMGFGYILGDLVMGKTGPGPEERRLELKKMSDENHARREKLLYELMESARKNS